MKHYSYRDSIDDTDISKHIYSEKTKVGGRNRTQQLQVSLRKPKPSKTNVSFKVISSLEEVDHQSTQKKK